MGISFVGSVANGASNGGDVQLDFTTITDLQPGDLVIVAYSIADNDNTDFDLTLSSMSGWTEIADLFADDSYETNLAAFWKIMGDPVDTGAQCQGLGGSDSVTCAVAMAFRNVDPATPFDVTSTTATGLNTYLPNPPSIDWSTAGVWTVIVGANGHGEGTETFTLPTGYTTNAVQWTENDTSDSVIGMGYNSSPSDPEDPGVFACTGSDATTYSWAAITMALRPKAAVTNYKDFSDTWSVTETLTRLYHWAKAFVDSWDVSDALDRIKKKTKIFADTWNVGESFASKGFFHLAIADTWSVAETFARKVKKIFSDTWNVSEAFVRKLFRAFADTWSRSDDLVATYKPGGEPPTGWFGRFFRRWIGRR